MLSHSDRERLLVLAEPFIRRVARRLIGRARFGRSDVSDIEQALRLDLWSRLRHYDVGRGDEAVFLKLVIDRQAAKLVRSRRAAKRDVRRDESLIAPEDVTDPRGGRAEDATDVRLDVADAVARLSSELAEMAELLRTESLTSAARTLGVTHAGAKGLARRLLARFRWVGLEDYIERP